MKEYDMDDTRKVLPADAMVLHSIVDFLERAVRSKDDAVFDLSKSLIETSCRTILKDLGLDFPRKEKFSKIVKETINAVNANTFGEKVEEKESENIKKLFQGFSNIAHQIMELRNEFGTISHSKDGYSKQAAQNHLLLLAQSAGIVVQYLFRTHITNKSSSNIKRIYYKDYPLFNDWVDETHDSISIFDMPYVPSQILYEMDREAYIEKLFESDYFSSGDTLEIIAKGEQDV